MSGVTAQDINRHGVFVTLNKISVRLLYAAYLVALLVALDFLAGLLYVKVAPAYGQKNIAIFLGQLDTKMALNEQPHPYMLWQNTPRFVSSSGVRTTNSLGYRNTDDHALVKRPGTLRVLALGGSTTWGYLLDDPHDTWPAQLEHLLANRIGAESAFDRVEVINGGLNYATSAELLLHYLIRDRHFKPDVVIIHTGGNDVAPMLFDNYDPEYLNFRPGWNPDIHRLRKGERFLVAHSNLFKLFYAIWLNDSVALPHINKQAGSFERSEAYYLDNVAANKPLGFERNLSLLLRNILDDGALPVIFPFILTSDRQFSTLTPDAAKRAAYTSKIRPAMLIALEKNTRVMHRLSETWQAPLITLAADEIPTAYFLDHTHLSRQGETLKAAFVAGQLCRLLPELRCATANAPAQAAAHPGGETD